MSKPCYGPVQDGICGAWYCPLDHDVEPKPGDSWDDCCRECGARRDWHDDLVEDCKRDEG